jgi:hypothetical protein
MKGYRKMKCGGCFNRFWMRWCTCPRWAFYIVNNIFIGVLCSPPRTLALCDKSPSDRCKGDCKVGDFGLATSSLAAVDLSDVSTHAVAVLDVDMTLGACLMVIVLCHIYYAFLKAPVPSLPTCRFSALLTCDPMDRRHKNDEMPSGL